LDAAEAAFDEVAFGGDTCESELPAAVLDARPVDGEDKTPDDLLATRGLVILVTILAFIKTVYKHSISN
jgi:hypothetical protein